MFCPDKFFDIWIKLDLKRLYFVSNKKDGGKRITKIIDRCLEVEVSLVTPSCAAFASIYSSFSLSRFKHSKTVSRAHSQNDSCQNDAVVCCYKVVTMLLQSCCKVVIKHDELSSHRSIFKRKMQFIRVGPWSSAYGRRLMFQRSWVWIPALYAGWTFFTCLFVLNFVMGVWKDKKN